MNQNFGLRLSVEGARQAGAALKGVPLDAAEGVKALGDASERAGTKVRGLRADTSNVTPAMRAINAAVRDVRSEFDDWAGRIPVVGSALQALGPAGLAAAAGVGAIAVGLNTMLQNSRQAVQQLGDLKDRAQEVNLSVGQLQAFRGAALLEGIDVETADQILATFATNTVRNAEGFGRMYAALQKVNPELAEQLRLTESQAARLDVVTSAIQQATSYGEKLNIAVAAFGPEGAQMIRVMEESGASMETWSKRAQAAGLVIEESLVAAADEVGKRMDFMAAQTEVAGQRLGIAMAGINEAIEEQKRNQALGWSMVLEEMNAIEVRAEWALRVRAQRDKELIAAGNDWFGIAAGRLKAINDELDRRAAAAANIADAAQRAALPADLPKRFAVLNGTDAPGSDDAFAKGLADAAAERERQAAEAARLRLGYERDAIQIRAELGDITGLLAAREKELNAIVAANVGVTRGMADEVLKRYRESLDGTAAAQARINAILDDAKTPAERLQDQITALTAAWVASGGTLANYGVALAALKSQLQDAVAVDADLGTGVETTAKKLGDATNALDSYSAQLGEARRLSLEVEFGMAGIVGILDQQIETWEDAGAVGLRVLRDIAIQAMYTAAQIEGANLGSIIAAGFGVFTGGWGGQSGAAGVSDNLQKGVGFKNAGVHHTGGIGGFPVHTRLVPGSIFENAPRNHRGYPLAADERAAILQVGEPVVSKWDANRIMRAVEGGGRGGDVIINISNNSGSEVTTSKRRTADGGHELDIMIGEKINGHIASGGADGPMRDRYNVQRQVGR